MPCIPIFTLVLFKLYSGFVFRGSIRFDHSTKQAEYDDDALLVNQALVKVTWSCSWQSMADSLRGSNPTRLKLLPSTSATSQ